MRELLLAAGVAALLFASGAFVPLLGPVAGFFAAVPIALLAARRGPRAGLLGAALAAAGLLAAGMHPLAGALFLGEHGAPGAWLGTRLARGKGLFRSALAAAAVVGAAGLAGLAAWTAGGAESPAALLERQLLDTIAAMAPEGPGAASLPGPAEVQAFVALLWRLLPGITFAGLFLEFSLNGLLVARVLQRGGAAGVRPPDLVGFRLPEWLVWPFIASLALALAPVPAAATVGRNAAIPLALLYLLQGLAVGLHLAARARLSRLGTMLLAVAFALQPYLLVVPFVLGVLDFRFDFRRRWPGTPPPPRT